MLALDELGASEQWVEPGSQRRLPHITKKELKKALLTPWKKGKVQAQKTAERFRKSKIVQRLRSHRSSSPPTPLPVITGGPTSALEEDERSSSLSFNSADCPLSPSRRTTSARSGLLTKYHPANRPLPPIPSEDSLLDADPEIPIPRYRPPPIPTFRPMPPSLPEQEEEHDVAVVEDYTEPIDRRENLSLPLSRRRVPPVPAERTGTQLRRHQRNLSLPPWRRRMVPPGQRSRIPIRATVEDLDYTEIDSD